MEKEEIENHPLMLGKFDIYDYINLCEEIDDKFTFLLALGSRYLSILNEENDNIGVNFFSNLLKEKLEHLLDICEVNTLTLYSSSEYFCQDMIRFLLSFFINTQYINIIIDGILDHYENLDNIEVLKNFLESNYDNTDIMLFLIEHCNWRTMIETINEALKYNRELNLIVKEMDVYDEFDF